MSKKLIENILKESYFKNVSLSQIEKATGLSNSSIRKWGEVNPSIDKVVKVADFLQVSIDSLLGREENIDEGPQNLHVILMNTPVLTYNYSNEEDDQVFKVLNTAERMMIDQYIKYLHIPSDGKQTIIADISDVETAYKEWSEFRKGIPEKTLSGKSINITDTISTSKEQLINKED